MGELGVAATRSDDSSWTEEQVMQKKGDGKPSEDER